jgi:cytidylate kinase
MQKVAIIGSPGAGKSTFSQQLGDILGLEAIHLDSLYRHSVFSTKIGLTGTTFSGCLFFCIESAPRMNSGPFANTK